MIHPFLYSNRVTHRLFLDKLVLQNQVYVRSDFKPNSKFDNFKV